MKLDELFTQPTIKEGDQSNVVDATENFIVDLITSIQARGINKMNLAPIMQELKRKSTSPNSSIINLDQEFLLDFLDTLDAVQEITPIEDTPAGDSNFEIIFKTSDDYDNFGDKESEEDKVSDKAMNTIDREQKDDETTSKNIEI